MSATLSSSSSSTLVGSREKRSTVDDQEIAFRHQPSYITLSRTLARLSDNILPLSPSTTNVRRADLTPDQQITLRGLLLAAPYHRIKTERTIEHARTLLLQLEQAAKQIKIQRVKREVVADLAEKRKLIRKLRGVVEELGREAERRVREREKAKAGHAGDGDGNGYRHDYEDDEDEDEGDGEGETVEELLGLPPPEVIKKENKQAMSPEPVPPTSPNEESRQEKQGGGEEALFHLRHRRGRGRGRDPGPPAGSTIPTTPTTSSTTFETEKALSGDRSTQESLTSSLVTLAAQLKSQSQSFSAALTTTDRTQLDRALAGLDSNVARLHAVTGKMGLLKRLTEGEGWWGRMMLYLWIWALWAVAVALVFLGPKFRF